MKDYPHFLKRDNLFGIINKIYVPWNSGLFLVITEFKPSSASFVEKIFERYLSSNSNPSFNSSSLPSSIILFAMFIAMGALNEIVFMIFLPISLKSPLPDNNDLIFLSEK